MDTAVKKQDQPPTCRYENGRVWFTREAERRFYFILTVIMLAIGILYKAGLLG